MKQKSEQIELLKKELAESQKRFDSIQSELQNAKTKVETNQANFVASYAQVVDNIQADIRKMEQYLK
jgi:septal ring factor EnvC (AmiA/AmiB activator)